MSTTTVIDNHSYIEFYINMVSTTDIHGNSTAYTVKADQCQVDVVFTIKPVLDTSKRGQSFSKRNRLH